MRWKQFTFLTLLTVAAVKAQLTYEIPEVDVPDGYFAPRFRPIDPIAPLTDMANPPIFNTDDCWFEGYTLESRPNTTLDYSPLAQGSAGYAYVISTENRIIDAEKNYVHSLWAWVDKPDIEFSLAIFQKVSDFPTFIIRHMHTFTPNRTGLHAVPVGRTVRDLGVPERCNELCTVRVGMIVMKSATSPVGYTVGDSNEYNFDKDLTHLEADKGLEVDLLVEKFDELVRRRYSISALVCRGNVSEGPATENPFDKSTPTARPDVTIVTRDVGTRDDRLIIIIATTLGAAALILLVIVVVCCVYRCRNAGSVPATTSKEADFIRNWNMGQLDGTFDRELMLPNDVYTSNKTVSRATGLQMKSVMTAFEGGELDPEKPVIYGNAAMFNRQISEMQSPVPMPEEEVVEELQEVSEVPPQELELKNELRGAAGKFACIRVADWKFSKSRQRVVVKQIRDKFSDRDIAIMEKKIDLLARLPPHPYVLGFIGPTTLDNTPAMVLEYCDEGTLKSYLSRQRNRTGMQRGVSQELVDRMPRFCYEIASAVDFLHRRNVIHTRLCARNVLLTRDFTCRLTGFGPQRDIDVADTEKEVWRWLAPESHAQKVYTRESDMWMFGVTAWEIFSIGSMPLSECATNEEVQQHVAAGTMPDKPNLCPADIYYEVIIPSWRLLPLERPAFSSVCRHLSQFAPQTHQPSLHAHSYVSVNTDGRQVLRPIPAVWLKGAFRKTMRSKKGGTNKGLRLSQGIVMSELPRDDDDMAPPPGGESPPTAPTTPLMDNNTVLTSGFDQPVAYSAPLPHSAPHLDPPRSDKPLPPEPPSVTFDPTPNNGGMTQLADWQHKPGF